MSRAGTWPRSSHSHVISSTSIRCSATLWRRVFRLIPRICAARASNPPRTSRRLLTQGPERRQRRGSETSVKDARVDPVLDQLLTKGVPVDAEDLRGPHLVAARLPEHRAQQGLLDQADHQVVEVGAGVLAETADALDELPLDDLLERRVHG